MTGGEFLKRLATRLSEAKIAYMVAGSFASTYHGIPRSTRDIDLVVDLDEPSLRRLIAAFPEEEYYLSADAARDALVSRSQFNIIDLATGWKADLIVRKDRLFSRIELERREKARVLGVEIFVATAEDAILSKLEWAKMGASERQLEDARGIIAVKGDALDRAYLAKWAVDLGVEDLLHSLG